MSKNTGFVKEFLNFVIYLVVVVVSIFLIYTFVAQQIEVSGYSMESTLHNQDRLILEKLTYHFSDPERFDIVVFTHYENDKATFYIKRIIGLPGEKVQILDEDIFIDGERLEESYGLEEIENQGLASEEITLGEFEYFVLGDNRNNSKDSRSKEVGNVSRDEIVGRAFLRIWPLSKIEIMKHK